MKTKEKQITVSNRELYEITLKLDYLNTAIEEMAMKVSSIGLSEKDKELETKYIPRNIYSSILFLLTDYSAYLNRKITEIIAKAGGDL